MGKKICPSCNGEGVVPDKDSTNKKRTRMCMRCDGKGAVVVFVEGRGNADQHNEPEGLFGLKNKMVELLDEIPGVDVTGSGSMVDETSADVSFIYEGTRYVMVFKESSWEAADD